MAQNDGSEYEMMQSRPDDLATELLPQEKEEPHNFSTRNKSSIHDFLRYARLQILRKCFGRKSHWHQEPRKVAIRRSRRAAALHCLLHLLPVGGAITLLVLRWMRYWLGDTQSLRVEQLNRNQAPDATTLQFVAKLHELLMQVSLVEIVLCIVRLEVTEGFVPLGALSGAVQATQLSYLWSLDFLSLFTTDAFRGRRWHKLGLILSIPTLMLLTALVGPSSAVLMIPDAGCPKTIEARKLHTNPIDTVFPIKLGLADGLNMNVASLNWTLDRLSTRKVNFNLRGIVDREMSYPDRSDKDRLLRMQNSSPGQLLSFAVGSRNLSWERSETIVVMPTRLTNRVLSYDIDRGESSSVENQTFAVTMPQSASKVACYQTGTLPNGAGPGDEIYFVRDDGASLGTLSRMSELTGETNSRGFLDIFYEYEEWQQSERQGQYFEPIWLASPEDGSRSSIVVFPIAIPSTTSELKSLDRLLQESTVPVIAITCTLSAFWVTAKVSIARTAELVPQNTQTLPIANLDLSSVRNITLDTTGIEVFHSSEFAACVNRQKADLGLAAALALAIADVPSRDATIGENYSKQFPMTDVDESIGIEYSAFSRERIWYAYGYCADSTSIRLSLAVILAYCTITIAYLLYILITGSTSTAWNSAIELVALALQSRKPDYPGRTAVGIDSISTFNQGIGIRVNCDNELELVFASDRDIDARGLKKVEKNVAY